MNVWNLKTGEKALTLVSGEKHEVSCIQVNASGKTLAVGYEDGSLRLFDLQSGKKKLGHYLYFKLIKQIFNHTNSLIVYNFELESLCICKGCT